MAYYDALAAEWAKLPAVSVGADVITNLVTLNAMTAPGPPQLVQIIDAVTYLRNQNIWLAIRAAASATPPNEAAMTIVDLNDDMRAQTIDFTNQTVLGMLAALVTAGLISQAQSNALVAMATPQIPWWQANGYTSIPNVHDLINAGCITEEFARAQNIY